MKIRMRLTYTGTYGETIDIDGYLTTEHATSSYGQPVYVADDGRVYGPGDVIGYLHRCPDTIYTPDEIQWVDQQIIDGACRDIPLGVGVWWCYGASWHTAAQLVEIERRLGRRLPLA